MTDEKPEDDILDIDGIEADFDNASTDDLKAGQDNDHTGDIPNGGK
jgi:hypothetical protein